MRNSMIRLAVGSQEYACIYPDNCKTINDKAKSNYKSQCVLVIMNMGKHEILTYKRRCNGKAGDAQACQQKQ